MNTQRQTVDEIAELGAWSAALQRVAANPLSHCAVFPRIAERFEAWWRHDMIDRPVFIAEANRNPARPITRRLDLLHDHDAWLEAKKADLAQTYCVGDAVPAIRIDLGPVALGPLIGAAHTFGADTSWTHAVIDDTWSNEPDWSIDEDGPVWRSLVALTRRVAEDAAGHYLLCTPDLGGSADLLLNLRGPDGLCMDVYESPDFVRQRLLAIYPAWHQAFTMLYRETLSRGAGLVHWHRLWSNVPYLIPACDFNFMIGPAHFNDVCLGDIARQVATVGRAVFHLDGPGAARHVDALLEVPMLEAIQFTPGEGAPSVMPWLDMFKRVQAAGRSLLVITPAAEVLDLCDALDPRGLAVWVLDGGSPEALDALFAAVRRKFAAASR